MNNVEILDPVRPVTSGGYKVDVSRGERNGRVSSEWFNRPDDERYLSLDDLWANVKGRSERSTIEAAGSGAGNEGKGLTVGSSSSCAGCSGVTAVIDLQLGPVAAFVRISSFALPSCWQT